MGLSAEELEDLAKAGQEGRAKKCSTRDIPLHLASHHRGTTNSSSAASQWGATTVASTMKLAHLAGISTFVTGGIGGVHRNGETSMDVSADLIELSRTPVVVISAGIKSILDIGRTLEVLETNSVPCISWQADEFPAFFSPHSGVNSPARMDSAEDIAAAYWAAQSLDMSSGMMVGVPNDDPAGAKVEEAIQEALKEADEKGIHGQAVTPFILKNVAERTEGDSLRSNIALVKNNAHVGADIAIAIAASSDNQDVRRTNNQPKGFNFEKARPALSAKNLAVLHEWEGLHMSALSPSQPTRDEILNNASLLLIHGVPSISVIQNASQRALDKGVPIMFIPGGLSGAVNAGKDEDLLRKFRYAVVDVEELLALSDGWTDNREDLMSALREPNELTIREAARVVLDKMSNSIASLLIPLGDKGVMLAVEDDQEEDVLYEIFPAPSGTHIHKGTASSDALLGAFVDAVLSGKDDQEAIRKGIDAVDSLFSSGQLKYPLLSQMEANKRFR